MIRAWIRYLILFILGSALYIFYVGYISYFLFLLIVSLPVISIVLYGIASYHFELQLQTSPTKITKGTTQELYIRSRTRVWIPLAKVEAVVSIHNKFHNTLHEETLSFTSECGYSDVILSYDFSTCGKYIITCSSIYVYDMLHLFKRKKRSDVILEVIVLPIPTQMQDELAFTPQLGEEEFDKLRPGNDPGETFDVHAYRAGDSLHKIHWKLSAKLDTMMVREFSMPIAKHVKLYFDLYGTSNDADTILAQVYGCSTHLLSTRYEHDILQYKEGRCIQEAHITNEEELVNFLCEILCKQVNMSVVSSLHTMTMAQDSILVQKNQVVTYKDKRGGELHASSK